MRVKSLRYEITDSVEENEEKLFSHLEASTDATDLIVGPEAAFTGVFREREFIESHARTINDESIEKALEIAGEKNSSIVFGIAEDFEGELYNSALLLESESIQVYRQIEHENNYSWVTEHGEPVIWSSEKLESKIFPNICSDIANRGLKDYVEDSNPDMVVTPSNYGETEYFDLQSNWQHVSKEIDAPVIISNGGGFFQSGGNEFEFDGSSAIIEGGETIAEMSDYEGSIEVKL